MSRYIFISLFIIFTITDIYNQDSLYLITTLTGESTENAISYAKGVGDINGDGYTDIIVSFSNYCNIYFGGEPFDWQPDVRFNSGGFHTPGDVNNDGYADVLINYGIWDDDRPVSYIMKLYFGGAVIDTIADFEFTSPYYRPWCSRFDNAIGDINGDDYNDFVISEFYNWSNGRGHVYLFFGGETIESEPALTFTLPPSGYGEFGNAVCGIGDANQDGFDDILISTLAVAEVYLYYGGSEMDTTIDRVFNQSLTYDFGVLISNVGDINNDGVNDFVINDNNNSYLYFSLDSCVIIEDYEISGGKGDINNDNIDDLLLGNPGYNYIGKFSIYCGKENFNPLSSNYSVEGESEGISFAKYSFIIGDINNDNYDEVIIGAPTYPNYDNRVGKLYLYSYQQFPVINEIKEHNFDYIPDNFSLQQNYPNPFNAATKIEYYLAQKSLVTIEIFNSIGVKIRTYNLGIKGIGQYSISWNGEDNDHNNMASGIYFVRLIAKAANNLSYSDMKKVVYLK
jgi:hypothetical protein